MLRLRNFFKMVGRRYSTNSSNNFNETLNTSKESQSNAKEAQYEFKESHKNQTETPKESNENKKKSITDIEVAGKYCQDLVK